MDTFYRTVNNCLSAPGLAITAGSSALFKYANTFKFKANGRISAAITTANAPSLALATLVAPFPNGTASVAGNLATLYSRIYTLVGTLPVTGSSTAAATFSLLAGPDFLTTSDLATTGYIAMPNQSNQTVIGTLRLDNATGSAFVPGTTALDVGSLTATYTDNYAQVGE